MKTFKKMLSRWLQRDGNSYSYLDYCSDKDCFPYEPVIFKNPSVSSEVTYTFGKASRITAITLSQWS